MYFKNRSEAGLELAKMLQKYVDADVVVLGIPRGGVLVAVEIARYLRAPLDLVIVRKISFPDEPEYAVAATTGNGSVIISEDTVANINDEWLKTAAERENKEIQRRRDVYIGNKPPVPVKGKVAILVDDGAATGLTMNAAILEIKKSDPKEVIVALPVISESIADFLKNHADEIVSVKLVPDQFFLGSVGAYYVDFHQIDDEELVSIMNNYEAERRHIIQRKNVSGSH